MSKEFKLNFGPSRPSRLARRSSAALETFQAAINQESIQPKLTPPNPKPNLTLSGATEFQLLKLGNQRRSNQCPSPEQFSDALDLPLQRLEFQDVKFLEDAQNRGCRCFWDPKGEAHTLSGLICDPQEHHYRYTKLLRHRGTSNLKHRLHTRQRQPTAEDSLAPIAKGAEKNSVSPTSLTTAKIREGSLPDGATPVAWSSKPSEPPQTNTDKIGEIQAHRALKSVPQPLDSLKPEHAQFGAQVAQPPVGHPRPPSGDGKPISSAGLVPPLHKLDHNVRQETVNEPPNMPLPAPASQLPVSADPTSPPPVVSDQPTTVPSVQPADSNAGQVAAATNSKDKGPIHADNSSSDNSGSSKEEAPVSEEDKSSDSSGNSDSKSPAAGGNPDGTATNSKHKAHAHGGNSFSDSAEGSMDKAPVSGEANPIGPADSPSDKSTVAGGEGLSSSDPVDKIQVPSTAAQDQSSNQSTGDTNEPAHVQEAQVSLKSVVSDSSISKPTKSGSGKSKHHGTQTLNKAVLDFTTPQEPSGAQMSNISLLTVPPTDSNFSQPHVLVPVVVESNSTYGNQTALPSSRIDPSYVPPNESANQVNHLVSALGGAFGGIVGLSMLLVAGIIISRKRKQTKTGAQRIQSESFFTPAARNSGRRSKISMGMSPEDPVTRYSVGGMGLLNRLVGTVDRFRETRSRSSSIANSFMASPSMHSTEPLEKNITAVADAVEVLGSSIDPPSSVIDPAIWKSELEPDREHPEMKQVGLNLRIESQSNLYNRKKPPSAVMISNPFEDEISSGSGCGQTSFSSSVASSHESSILMTTRSDSTGELCGMSSGQEEAVHFGSSGNETSNGSHSDNIGSHAANQRPETNDDTHSNWWSGANQ